MLLTSLEAVGIALVVDTSDMDLPPSVLSQRACLLPFSKDHKVAAFTHTYP